MRFCIVCKQPIEPERADGLRDTRLCTRHGREIEKFGGEFTMRTSQERTSKPGSLKLNYGGVNIRRRRNEAAIEKLRAAYELEQMH